MNTKLLVELQQELHKRKGTGEAETLQALIEAGATDKDKVEILQALQDNGHPDPLSLYYRFCGHQTEALHKQEAIAQRMAVQERLNKIKAIATEAGGKDGVTLADLSKPIQDIADLQAEIGRIQDNSRGSILIPPTRTEIVEEIKNKPEALETGYELGGKEEKLSFQTGGFTIIAAPTGHGKTTMLMNVMLDLARRYPDKRHWFFSYEEGRAAIAIKTLNAYCNNEYSDNNKRTMESYYKGDPSYFHKYHDDTTKEYGTRLVDFQKKEQRFWELVENGTINIIATDHPADELVQVIREIADDKTGFIGIDYIQLLSRTDSSRYASRADELKRICLDLKDIAVEKGLAIVAAGQFNRQVLAPWLMEAQGLADASDIEKAANKVIGVWNGDKQPKTQDKNNAFMSPRGIKEGTMYLEVLKARDERSGDYAVYEYNGNRGHVGERVEVTVQPVDGVKGNGNGTMKRGRNETAEQRMEIYGGELCL
jgi:hypothetical protein